MATLTGSSGALRFNGQWIGKVREYALSLSREALEETCLGATSRSYVPGLLGATGSCTVLLDPNDDGARSLVNSILTPDRRDAIEFVFDRRNAASMRATGFVTDVSPSVAVGSVQSASISFQLTGSISGGF